MIELPNGCSRSEITVFPDNWQYRMDLLEITCYLRYKFHDPRFAKIYPNGKKFTYKQDINTPKTVATKVAGIKKSINILTKRLKDGYNPFTRTVTVPQQKKIKAPTPVATAVYVNPATDYLEQKQITITAELLKGANLMALALEKKFYRQQAEAVQEGIINIQILRPDTVFIESLWAAYKKLHGVRGHLTDVRCCIRAMTRAAFILGFMEIPITEIKKRHIRLCLEVCGGINPKWSNERHNKYKWYLQALFRELSKEDAVDKNIIEDISTLIESERARKMPRANELATVDRYLKAHHYYFWRLVRIFFYSGSRETELMQLRVKDVDLEKREYLAWIYKGKRHKQVYRPISKLAYPLWIQVLQECAELAERLNIDNSEIVLFSKFLQPGLFTIRPDQFGKRWREIVKKKLGINIDLYTLKHLYSDQIAALLGLDHAQAQDAHDSPETTKIYAVGEQQRKLERLKKVEIPFVPTSPLSWRGGD